jgi:hypothetical protein
MHILQSLVLEAAPNLMLLLQQVAVSATSQEKRRDHSLVTRVWNFF